MAHACNPSTLGARGGQIIWGQEFETSLTNMMKHPISTKSIKISPVWWRAPVISATQEAEAGVLLESRRQRLQWAKIMSLHSNLGDKARFSLKNKHTKTSQNTHTHTHTHTHTPRPHFWSLLPISLISFLFCWVHKNRSHATAIPPGQQSNMLSHILVSAFLSLLKIFSQGIELWVDTPLSSSLHVFWKKKVYYNLFLCFLFIFWLPLKFSL